MSGVSIEHNRRAVYHALDRVLDDRTLVQQAYDVWEQVFSSSKIFRVNQYLETLKTQVGLKDTIRRQLAVAVYAALAQPVDKLNAVPGVMRAAPAAATPTQPEAASRAGATPAAVVFGEVIRSLVEATLNKGGGTAMSELREVLGEILAEQTVDRATVAGFSSWSSADFAADSVPADIDASQRQAVVHATYLAVCEVLGPDLADRLLSRAVASAAELPEADAFAPASLL